MAQRGQVFRNGGNRLEVVTSAADSDGAVLELLATWGPRSPVPPAHLHPAQDERFDVLDGELWFRVDGVEHVVAAGSRFDVPRGCVHQVCNRQDVPAVARWRTTPALRTEQFHEAVHAALAAGDVPALLAVVAEHADVFVLAEQPG